MSRSISDDGNPNLGLYAEIKHETKVTDSNLLSEATPIYKYPKPPKVPLQRLHLPLINSPCSMKKQRYSILYSPVNASEEPKQKKVYSITPNNSLSRDSISSHSNSITNNKSLGSTEETEKSDIEKITDCQKYFKFKRSKLDSLKSAIELKNTKKVKDVIKSLDMTHQNYSFRIQEPKETNILPEIKPPGKDIIRKIIIPDIPKAAFGVHIPYHDLDLDQDFKTIEVNEKPRDPKFKKRSEVLSKEKDLRDKILSELLLEKHNKYTIN